MKKRYQQLKRWVTGQIRRITPGKNAVRGAALGLLMVTAILWIIFALGTYLNIRDGWVLLFFLAFVLAAILAGYAVRWAISLLNKLPGFLKLALFITIPLLLISSFDLIIVLIFGILSLLSGAAVMVFRKTGFQNLPTPKKIVLILGALLGAWGIHYGRISVFPKGL